MKTIYRKNLIIRYIFLLFLGSLVLSGCLKQSPPNFLFAIADDASFPHMGAYGTDWVKTPAFDRVAADGILFGNAYTPNAKCAPSRACILTGRNSWQLEEAANHWCYFPTKFKSFAEVLDAKGYKVGYTLKGWAPGIALNADGSPRDLLVKKYNQKRLDPPTSGIANMDYAGNFENFLNEVDVDESFFFWYGSVEPHRSYEFNSGLRLSNKSLQDIDKVPAVWPDTDTVKTDLLDYAFEIEYFDSHLAKMIKMLEEKELLNNTVVIVTSDNGMPFPRIKGQAYERSNHLPLAIMWPKGIKKSGRRVDEYVSFIDLAPTILELAEIDPDQNGMAPIQGTSLVDILQHKKRDEALPLRDHVLIGKERHDIGRPDDVGYPIRGIVKDGYLYIRNFKSGRWPAGNPETGYLNTDGSPTKSQILDMKRYTNETKWWDYAFFRRPGEELYQIEIDPDCINNLARHPNHQSIKRTLSEQLTKELRQQSDPRILGQGDIFDKYLYADEKNRAFYNRYMGGENIKAGWVELSDFEKSREK